MSEFNPTQAYAPDWGEKCMELDYESVRHLYYLLKQCGVLTTHRVKAYQGVADDIDTVIAKIEGFYPQLKEE